MKVIEYAFNQPNARQQYKHKEYDRLISELKRQDNEIQLLRKDIESMRQEQQEHYSEMNYLRTNWYELRTIIFTMNTYIKVHPNSHVDEELRRMFDEAFEIVQRIPDQREN